MTIEEDFATVRDLAGDWGKPALDRIETHCKIAWARVTVNVDEELLAECAALKVALKIFARYAQEQDLLIPLHEQDIINQALAKLAE